jgi:hypothetical protein
VAKPNGLGEPESKILYTVANQLLGRQLRSKAFEGQATETKIADHIVNRIPKVCVNSHFLLIKLSINSYFNIWTYNYFIFGTSIGALEPIRKSSLLALIFR